MRRSAALGLGLALAFGVGAAPLGAQGLDCASATPIAGLGTFAYDNTTGGQSTFGDGTLCNASSQGNSTERYFLWTATSAGDFEFRLNIPGGDRRLGVFSGSDCSAVCIGRSTLTSYQGVLQWRRKVLGVQSGDTFLVRIANANQPGGTGTLEVTWDPCYPPQIVDDALEDNDTCSQAVLLSPGITPPLFESPQDPDHFLVRIPPLHRAVLEYLPTGDSGVFETFDANCQPLGQATFFWDRSNLGFTDLDLVVRTRGFTGSDCTLYQLELTFVPLDCGVNPGMDDLGEDNDTCATALALTPGTYAQLWTSSLDRDYYEIDLEPGENLSAQALSGASELGFDLFDETCQPLAASNGNLGYTNFTTQTQHVRLTPIRRVQASEPWCAGYDLTVTVADNPCADLGPDVLHDHEDYRYLSNGSYPNLYLGPSTYAYFCIPPGSTFSADLALERLDGTLDANLICTLPLSDCFFLPTYATGSGQSFALQYTNSASTYRVVQLILQYSGGTADCNHVDLVVQGAGGCELVLETQDFCQPAQPNSTGVPTQLFASQPYDFTDDVQLEAMHGPSGQFGYLLAGTAWVEPGTPVSQGRLCLDLGPGQQVGRYNVAGSTRNSLGRFDAFGRFENLFGTSDSAFGYSLPGQTPWGSPFLAGQSYSFQLWHREAGGASNFSNGVRVMF